jgi:ubiquinone/menaquinone biosynthesis C-methylase UbiE
MTRPDDFSVGDLVMGYRRAKVVFTAVKVGVFELLRLRPLSSAQVASALSINLRAGEVLLDALAALGLLKKQRRLYSLAPHAACFLKDSPDSLHHNLCYQNILWRDWQHLDDVVKTGRPPEQLTSLLHNKVFTEEYIRGMAEISRRPAREIALLLSDQKVSRLLDVGGGHGAYSMEILKKNPAAQAVVLDVPGTLAVTHRLHDGDPAFRRVMLRHGDYLKDDFGRNEFDLVLMSHVTHDEGPVENLRLFKKAMRALRPGGRIAIHDFVVSEDGTSPAFGALFSVHMMVYSRKGKTYALRDYNAWAVKAGFRRFSYRDVCAGAQNASVLMTAFKP